MKEERIEELKRNCPFKPNTERQTNTYFSQERLLHEADLRREKRERLRRRQIEQEMGDCTFKPNINRKSSAPSIVNINKLIHCKVTSKIWKAPYLLVIKANLRDQAKEFFAVEAATSTFDDLLLCEKSLKKRAIVQTS